MSYWWWRLGWHLDRLRWRAGDLTCRTHLRKPTPVPAGFPLGGPISDRIRRTDVTKKTRYVGRESGKSSTKWFGGNSNDSTGGHGHGARAGDGWTTQLGKVVKVVFRKGK